MEALTKKTTILFSPTICRKLEHIAKQQHISVAHLIRQAAIQCYMLPDQRTRLEAVEALASMKLPVGDWSAIEREITHGITAA